MKKIIKALIKRPGEPAEMALIENELKAFQKIVGGYIETVTIATNMVLICNEEGRLIGLPFNENFNGIDFYGTLIIVSQDGEDFDDLYLLRGSPSEEDWKVYRAEDADDLTAMCRELNKVYQEYEVVGFEIRVIGGLNHDVV